MNHYFKTADNESEEKKVFIKPHELNQIIEIQSEDQTPGNHFGHRRSDACIICREKRKSNASDRIIDIEHPLFGVK